jgi:hypothetical protein
MFLTTSRKARLFALTAAAIAVGGLAGCGGGDDASTLMHTIVKVDSITQGGSCEDLNVKVSPVDILPNPPKMSNSKEFITPVTLTKGADGVSCSGTGTSIPMAPGKWKFTAMLPSGVSSCEHDVPATGASNVAFKDGETACQ